MRNSHLICEGQQHGPVVVAGDFNAHLGVLGGPKGEGEPNRQGLLVKDLVDRCSLHVMSLSERAEGPGYTFWNSVSETTVDYILGDVGAASCLDRCFTHPQAPLNSSDHLPVSALLQFEMLAAQEKEDSHEGKLRQVNWSKAQESDSLGHYQMCVGEIVNPLIGKSYESTVIE